MTYLNILKKAIKRAEELNLESEAVKILVQELSGYDNATFIMNLNNEIEEEKIYAIEKALYEYLEHKIPIQYILGYCYFFGYKFTVNNNVLIPRQETEELVELVLRNIQKVFETTCLNIVDIGCGSGCIAIALKKQLPNLNVFATDISKDALEVAKLNAKNLNTEISFLEGDMLEPLINNNLKFDVIVSNPPYVKYSEHVDDIVLANEPHLALFAEDAGMKYYDIILKDASKILNKPSIICFEHGFEQKELMTKLISKYFPSSSYSIIKDINGKDRMTLIINR